MKDMPSKPVNVQRIAFRSLTNVNNKQNEQRVFLRVIIQQTLYTGNHTADITVFGVVQEKNYTSLTTDTSCDTMAMR